MALLTRLDAVYRYFAPPEPEPYDEVFAAELADWVARSQALEDSIALARAERRARFERPPRDGRYASAPRTGRENARGRRRYNESLRDRGRGGGSARARYAAAAAAIDYSVPLPAAASLDPNTVDSATLLRLGVRPDLMRRWLKFRGRGGSFVRRADIARVYGLADTTYERIAGYFVDGVELERNFPRRRPSGEHIVEPVEVNGAEDADLQRIPGIGPYYAKRILDYRDRLGGFVTAAQIGETPRLRDSTWRATRRFMRVDSTDVRLLAINVATAPQLARHPYLTRAQAETLVRFRKNRGPFRSADDLRRAVVVDEATIARLAPYLDYATGAGR